MRAYATALIVICAVLAGCAESPPAPEPVQEAPVAETFSALNITVEADAPTSSHDFLFGLDADAPVAGHQITIPTDTTYALCDFCSERLDVMLAPIYTEAPESMAVLVFDMDTMDLAYGYVAAPFSSTTYLTAALPSSVDEPADLSTTVISLPGSLAGTTVGIVVAGQGITAPTGLGIHFPAGEVPYDAELPQGEGVFTGRPATPAVIGTGTGFDIDAYIELNLGLLYTPGLLGVDAYIGEPTVVEELPTYVKPHGGARDASITAASGTSGGWSLALTTYLAGEGATQWSHRVRAGGHDLSDEGYLVWGHGYGLVGSALVFGLPVGLGIGDGPEPPIAELGLTSVTDNDIYLLVAETISLDQPLGVLLGRNATGGAVVFDGLLSVDAAGGSVFVDHGGTRIEHAGIWPTDPGA